MSRFNQQSEGIKTTNLSNAKAYSIPKEQEFLSLILTSFLNDQFYRKGNDSILKLKELLESIKDKRFLAQAAWFARHQFGMRTVSHVVASELAKMVSGESWARDFYTAIARRPDDMTEILAYYFKDNAKLSNAIKFGFKSAFDKFDTYQLAKYRQEDKTVSMVDVVNLVHPIPTKRNEEGLNKLINGTLRQDENNETWESISSSVGRFTSDKEKWEYIVDMWIEERPDRLVVKNYLAILRNLRNVVDAGVSVAHMDKVCAGLTDDHAISTSLIFPFQYLTAYRLFKNYKNINAATANYVTKVLTALSQAVFKSVFNIPKFKGDTLFVMDNSGSMSAPLNPKVKSSYFSMREGAPEEVTMKDVAALFGIAMTMVNKSDFMVFGAQAKYYPLNLDGSLLDTVMEVSTSNLAHKTEMPFYVGHTTNMESIFLAAEKKYDRIVIFTDNEGNGFKTGNQGLQEYKKKYEVDPFVYVVDLAGYGTTQFPDGKVFHTSGFSEKIFDFMTFYETDPNVLIETIKSIDFKTA